MPDTVVNVEGLRLIKDNKSEVKYPPWASITLTVTGLATFSTVGFLGFSSHSYLPYPLAHPVWIMFIWYSSVAILIQATIFRAKDPTVRRWRWETIAVTLICIGCGIVVYAKPDIVSRFLDTLQQGPGAQRVSESIFWHILNFLPLAIYAGDRIILWVTGDRVRFATELAASYSAQRQDGQIPATFWQLDKWEMASQDFFGGAALSLALSLLLRDPILNGFLAILPLHSTGIHINRCMVTIAFGACQNGAANNPPTLSAVDVSIGLVCLLVSVGILVIHLVPRAFELVTMNVAPNVAVAVGKILLAIFNPLAVFFRTLRVVVWPAFIAAGVISAAISAHFLRLYLHLISDKRTCVVSKPCDDLREFGINSSNSRDTANFLAHALPLQTLFLIAALVAVVVAVVAILTAAQVLVFGRFDKSWLLPNWLKFVGILGVIIGCFYGLLSLLLSIFMYTIQSLNVTQRTPFPQFGVMMLASLAIFLALLAISLLPFRENWGREVWRAMFSFVRPSTRLSERLNATATAAPQADQADQAD